MSEQRPLHVGVNLLWLVPGVVGGSEEYTTRLLRALLALASEDLRITLFVLAPFVEAHPDLVDAFETEVLDLDGRSRATRVGAEVAWLARQASRHEVDLLHHAGGVIPPGPVGSRFATVLTIHDLQPLLFPANFSALRRRWIGAMVPRSAARADLIVTPSDPASRSVVEHLGIPEDRVCTVPHGVEPAATVDPAVVDEVRRRYDLSGPVILYPAITYPHKDHRTLVEAFTRVAAKHGDAHLVLTGGAGPSEVEVSAAIRRSGVGAQVRRTGRVPWADLDALYAIATVVTVPSRFEGFGAPVLEAMAADVAVIAADATALPWVVGDAAVLVAPGDVRAWADAIDRILVDPVEQARLGAAGVERAKAFSWPRAGQALADAYRRAGASVGGRPDGADSGATTAGH